MSENRWLLGIGLLCVLFGVSYIAWGNWIPFAATVNSPTAAGVYSIVIGTGFLVCGAAGSSKET